MSRLFAIADLEKAAAQVKFDLDALAADCGVCLRQLQRLFKAQYDQCPSDWFRKLRGGRASWLTRHGYELAKLLVTPALDRVS